MFSEKDWLEGTLILSRYSRRLNPKYLCKKVFGGWEIYRYNGMFVGFFTNSSFQVWQSLLPAWVEVEEGFAFTAEDAATAELLLDYDKTLSEQLSN